MTDTEWLLLSGLGAVLAIAACTAHHLLTRDKPVVDLVVDHVTTFKADNLSNLSATPARQALAITPSPRSDPGQDDPVEIAKWLRNMAYCRGSISDLDAGYLLSAALVISTAELRTQQAVVSALEAAEAYRVREDQRPEWYCEGEAIGYPTAACTPENQIHSSPCGWKS